MSPPRTPLRELTTLPSPPSRMGKGTPTAPRSWRITFKFLPPPLCVSHATSQGGLTPCVPQKFWAPPTPSGLTWVLPLWIGCGWPPKIRSSTTCCHIKYRHSRSRHTRVIKVIRHKIDLSRSAFQGNSMSFNWHRSIGNLWLPISDH